MSIRIYYVLALMVVLSTSCVAKKKPATSIVSIETSYGKITFKLYPETSKHRENFIKLVDKGFYNGLLFHRVIAGFMVQGGDPQSKMAKSSEMLGSGDVGYTVPAEFIYPRYYHKRGALAAAREGDQVNPLKASSGCQFYIVQGKTLSPDELDALEGKNKKKLEQKIVKEITDLKQAELNKYRSEHNLSKLNNLQSAILKQVELRLKIDTTYKFTKKQRVDYEKIGGAPHLDGNYTVFGEVVEGMDVIDKIAAVEKDVNDRPLTDVKIIKAEIVK